MTVIPQKKNKVRLADYNFQRDVENRLLMADLSLFEVDILRELLNGSLHTSITDLCDNLQIEKEKLVPALEKFGKAKLLIIEGDHVIVNKENRKYFESQIIKFDNDFEPGIHYLIGLLSKVSIHHLPSWYAIPKSSDNIFISIIEKYLLTPKIYQKYLDEMALENPIFHQILNDILASADFKVSALYLRNKYGMTRDQFEEAMLLLEFNFICCLSYDLIEGRWEEMVTPFFEWREYLLTMKKFCLSPINEISEIKIMSKNDLSENLDTLIYNDKCSRSIEKELLRVKTTGWVYFKDFVKVTFPAFCDDEPIKLKKTSKNHWRYVFPTYTNEEIAMIRSIIFEKLFEADIVAIGTHKGEECFSITPFGYSALS